MVQPSGKATVFDTVTRRFDSYYPKTYINQLNDNNIPEINITQPNDKGKNTFQPKRIN